MPELYTGAVHSQTIDVSSIGGKRGTRAIHNNTMFPHITTNMGATSYRPRDTGFSNADISVMDTASLGPVQEVQRIVDNHQANHLKKEVFVPSQINPRMKRRTGKSVMNGKQRLQSQARGASVSSFGTATVQDRNRSFSLGQKHSTKLGSKPLHVASTYDQQNLLADTRNSFAKHMQNPDDTQYQTAIMREARQKQMVLEATRAVSQQSQQTDHPLMDQSEYGGIISPTHLSPAATAAANELIHKFYSQPNEPISSEAFLSVQRKYELPPFEAYQLLLQQIQFQKSKLTPPTAATVIKVSHNSYTNAVYDKR